ncbi:ABC2_membrane domain-containing protein [Cephalotus follicularis]|uniref:ABC2_membrane domain-containing protein n=1 Tax=Cephalotus follicularis TaxID=3775 RepID=A0A1Q3DBP6_CEPFO|nr:ABC2_membrane domain-containing protein [Cephalotus follicularis]
MINYLGVLLGQGISGVPQIPNNYNPATWMHEVTTPGVEERIGAGFAQIYRNSEQYREVEASIKHLSTPLAGSEPLKFVSTYAQNNLTQFWTCLRKQNLVYWRSPQYNAMRLVFTTISAVIFGAVYWNVGLRRDSTKALLMVMGVLYAACLFLGVNNASSVQPIVSIERTVFYREKTAGIYSPLSYAAAQVSIIIVTKFIKFIAIVERIGDGSLNFLVNRDT